MSAKYKHTRKSDTSTVGEAIQDLLKNYNLSDKFDEEKVIDSWGKLMGATIVKRTEKLFIKNKVLFIRLNSAPLRNELNMSKDKVKAILEKEVGTGIINEIIFM